MSAEPVLPPLRADAIAALLTKEIKPVFFLGAGASFKSGIPLAGMLVDAIARFAYCKAHNRNPDDPTLMRSDWIRWLEQQSWFRSDRAPADLYPSAVEYLLRPQSNRKEFFQRILRPEVPVSEGYKRLASLLARRAVRTVLTTNFDDLVVRTAKQTPAVHHVEEIFTPSDHTLFRTNPPHPQVVYLHGSVNHYTDRNLVRETQELDKALVALLQPLLRDHPLVVIGYRGTERSIMKHLLVDQAELCGRFREGIYWCHLPGSVPRLDSPYVAELAATIGSNLQFVEIDGFDELLVAADRSVQASTADTWGDGTALPEAAGAIHVHDLLPSSLTLDSINTSLLKTKLVEYASAMRLPVPSLDTEEGLWTAMLTRNIATRVNGGRCATKGGQLLFAKDNERQVAAAKIQVVVSGLRAWVDEILDQPINLPAHDGVVTESTLLAGDLWTQLDQASNLLSRINRPFRLKGPVSQTAYPYPPLALKELLTNLLAHRDYQRDQPAEIHVTRDEIRFLNPGGLIDSVRRQLEDESIQQAVGGGFRRVKGYRNPVVADFFFSAGAMDKAGSGLPDVVQEAANNLNTVSFGPDRDNMAFVATIQCRPEALLVDEETKTARSQQGELRYSPNLLRVIDWPLAIHKLGTVATPQEIARAERARPAPFGAHRGWLWTFADLTAPDTRPLLELSLVEEQHQVPTPELLSHRDAGSVLPRLLNTAIGAYLQRIGLRVRFEIGRLRAYYPSNDGAPREISYKSTFRQSKRTVAKPIVSRTTGKTVYWEHKAVALRFEKFGSTWALSLLPGYVFTLDGDSQPIASERIGPLSTRRSSRDYNPTVLHDLVFWSRMLSAGSETEFAVPLTSDASGPVVTLAPMIPTFVFQESIETGIADATEVPVLPDEELDALHEEIEQAIADSAAQTEERDEAADR
jgi:NAD-dependent SIR2 family protein deacetylase